MHAQGRVPAAGHAHPLVKDAGKASNSTSCTIQSSFGLGCGTQGRGNHSALRSM
jgi:hypothetical protein